jgi:hypothetical protein
MKKAVGILIALLIVGAVGAYFFWYKPLSPPLAPAQILPADTLACLEVRNLKQTLDEFRDGPIGQAIGGIDVREAALRLDADPEEIEELIKVRDQVMQGVESPWFDEFFGQEVLIAIFPLEIDMGEEPSAELFQRSLVLVTRPRQPADLIDTLGKMFVKDLDITAETIEGHTINRAVATQGDGPPIFYAVTRGLAVTGLDPDPILRCLNQSNGESAGLVALAPYQELEKSLGAKSSDRFKLYWDLEASLKWIEDAAPRLGADPKEMEELRQGLKYLAGFEALGITSSMESGKPITQKMRFRFDPENAHPMMAGAIGRSPETNPTLAMVPPDPIYYSWQNTQDLKGLWESLKSFEDFKAEDLKAFENSFQQFTGVSVDDAVAAVGPQVAWVFNDLITGGLFPVPELGLMVEVHKPDVLQRIISSLGDRIGVPLATESMDDQLVTYAQTPLGEDLRPAFICSGDYCTIATNMRLLKRMVSPVKGEGLDQNPKFKALDQGLSGDVNQVVFIDLQKGASKVKDVLKWSASMAAMTNQDDGPKITYLFENIVNPLLDAMAQYPAMGQKAVLEAKSISVDLYIQTPRPGE